MNLLLAQFINLLAALLLLLAFGMLAQRRVLTLIDLARATGDKPRLERWVLEAARLDPDEYLTRAGLGDRKILHLQGGAEIGDNCCSHGVLRSGGRTFSSM